MSDCSTNVWRVPEDLTLNGYSHSQIARGCSEKSVYPTRAIAKRWAKKRGLSVYRCCVCGLYHLTSQRKGKQC